MLEFIRNNLTPLIIFFLWWFIGTSSSVAGIIVILLSIFLFKRSGLYEELFIGFLLVLIMSDSLEFAKNVKDIYLLILAFFLIYDKNFFTEQNSIIKLFIPFFAIAFICIIWSEEVTISLQKTISYFLLIFVVTSYIQNLYKNNGTEFFRKLILFVCLILFIGILAYFINPYSVTFVGRYKGILFRNPNGIGIFGVLIFLLYYLIIEYFPTLFSRNEKLLIFITIVSTVILCSSRSAVISILIFLLFRSLYRISPILGFLLFLVFIFIYQYIISNAESLILSLGLEKYFRLDTLESGSGRIIAWAFAWENVQKSFWFGQGFGFTEFLFHKNYMFLSRLGHEGNAHNSYLTFWLDTGFLGVACYFISFISIFINGMKRLIGAIPILYAVLFSIYFESWLTASLNPFTIILFIIITLLTLKKTEATETITENSES